MGKKFVLLPICFIMLIVLINKPLPVSACSCMMHPPVEEAFSNSHAVFSGKVIGINERIMGASGKSILFEVNETWKGVSETEIKIMTGLHDGDCGLPFVVGQEYLVYAQLSDMYGKNQLSSTICHRTTELGNAAEDIQILGQGQKPTDEVSDNGENASSAMYIVASIVFVIGLLSIFGWYILKKRK